MSEFVLSPGQVIVTEGNRYSIISIVIAFFTKSWYTHCFMVLEEGQSIEATTPRVRLFSTEKRLQKLIRQKRSFIVLDHPALNRNPELRTLIIKEAKRFLGRFYDYVQLLSFAVSGGFFRDGPKRVVCSRLITAIFKRIDLPLFPKEVLNNHGMLRKRDLYEGEAIPVELLQSALVPVGVFDGENSFRILRQLSV